jgi:proton glutamate symport protein
MKRLSTWVLLGLLAGLAGGALIRVAAPGLSGVAEVLGAFGSLWLSALQMTVVPLVFALLITGIASVADSARAGGLVLRAIGLFSVLLLFAGTYSVLATQGLLALWPVPREAAAAFVAGVGSSGAVEAASGGVVEWLRALAPGNPIKAAADDNVLALVVFAIFFGFATMRLPTELRTPLVAVTRAIAEAMIVIVHWVLLAGPFGVFALALGVGLSAGADAVGTLAHYVVVVTAVTAGSVLLAWLLAIVLGAQPLARFSRVAAPVWAIAASTQSSLASLPAMLEAALRGLRLPPAVADVVLPLAVAIFRFTSPVANLAVCLFVAHLYGIEFGWLQLGGAVLVAFAVSIASVGLPGQLSFVASIAPICLVLGVPTEALGILIAVEVIPDIFRTLGNVTADLAATAIVSRGAPIDNGTSHD